MIIRECCLRTFNIQLIENIKFIQIEAHLFFASLKNGLAMHFVSFWKLPDLDPFQAQDSENFHGFRGIFEMFVDVASDVSM